MARKQCKGKLRKRADQNSGCPKSFLFIFCCTLFCSRLSQAGNEISSVLERRFGGHPIFIFNWLAKNKLILNFRKRNSSSSKILCHSQMGSLLWSWSWFWSWSWSWWWWWWRWWLPRRCRSRREGGRKEWQQQGRLWTNPWSTNYWQFEKNSW